MDNKKPDALEIALTRLSATIRKLPSEKQSLLTAWIFKWAAFIASESVFKPEAVPHYKRGDIVYADFGFNIGNEFGGVHYAAVLEVNNHKSSGTIIIVPLTSLDTGKAESDVPAAEVYLGENIIPWTQSATIAKPQQIRTVSKMRILKPLKKGDKKACLKYEHLNAIDKKLKQIIFNNSCLQK